MAKYIGGNLLFGIVSLKIWIYSAKVDTVNMLIEMRIYKLYSWPTNKRQNKVVK